MDTDSGFWDNMDGSFETPLPLWDDGSFFNPWESFDAGISGTPGGDSVFWNEQTTPFTCAVVSQQSILNQFGIDVSESQLVYDATSNGWLTDGGTSPEDMGSLLEYYGVETHTNMNASISDVMTELSQGRKVIVAVDSGEMWGQEGFSDELKDMGMGADHALVITGVDVSDPNNPMVFVNDSGEPSGAGKAYPMDQFVDAWEDSGCRFVATNDAPADILSSPFGGNFNAETGFYLDPAFWSALGVGFTEGIQTGASAGAATFAVTGSVDAATVVGGLVAGVDVFSNTLEVMNDVQRNDLFLTV